jgi:CRISPR-associated protein Cas2
MARRERAGMPKGDEPVWCMVMFDLPVKTKLQRTEAAAFRNMLLDNGYQMAQYSVYVRFSPSLHSILPAVRTVKKNLPAGGEVRIVFVTDHQWSKSLRFANEVSLQPEEAPLQLTIF